MNADVVIVNWNAGEQLTRCLASIAECCREWVASVIVVDNASSDDSLDGIEQFKLPLTVIRNPENRGFAAACNQGAALGTSEFVLFLNPDTRLFADSLSLPLEFMNRSGNAEIGICGIQLLDEAGEVARSCDRFPNLGRSWVRSVGLDRIPLFHRLGVQIRHWDHGETRRVDHVMGAFFLVRRSVFDLIDGFDERFFLYFEDLDFSYRAHKAGWQSMYIVDARAFHAGGGLSRRVKATRLFYFNRSHLLYGFKHFSTWQAWILAGTILSIEPLTRIGFSLLKGKWADARSTVKGYLELWAAFPEVVHPRKAGTRLSRHRAGDA